VQDAGVSKEKSTPLRLAASNAVGAVWWYFLIRGLLLLGAGIFILVKPGLTAVAFANLIGILILVDGAVTITAGLLGQAESRLWSILRGVLMLLAGLFVFLHPAQVASITATTIFFIVAPFIILGGLLEIFSTVRARGEKGSLVSGLLITLFGVLLILAPLFFGKLLLIIIAVVAIVFSLVLLYLARKFSKLRKRIP